MIASVAEGVVVNNPPGVEANHLIPLECIRVKTNTWVFNKRYIHVVEGTIVKAMNNLQILQETKPFHENVSGQKLCKYHLI